MIIFAGGPSFLPQRDAHRIGTRRDPVRYGARHVSANIRQSCIHIGIIGHDTRRETFANQRIGIIRDFSILCGIWVSNMTCSMHIHMKYAGIPLYEIFPFMESLFVHFLSFSCSLNIHMNSSRFSRNCCHI